MNDLKKKLIFAASAVSLIPVAMLFPGHAPEKKKAPFAGRYYAHRGLHNREKTVPENSLPAFALAAEAGYGIELDVQLSRDGHVVVFHDDDLKRVCGVDKRVDELDLSELQKLSLCGSSETIPLFTDVLSVIDGRGPIICEFKTGKRNRELCEKTYKIIRGYKGDICIESFDPTIVAWFRFHAPELLRGQLANTPDAYEGVDKKLAFLMSRCLLNFAGRPQFIAYRICKTPLPVRLSILLGAMDVCWTSHGPGDNKGRDCVIFEFYRPETRFR